MCGLLRFFLTPILKANKKTMILIINRRREI